MAREYHYKRHLVEARTNRFRFGLALMALAVTMAGVATPALLTHADTTYDSHATILVTGDYQGSISATSSVHSFGTCTSAIGQLFTIQAGFNTTCDGVAFGSPDGLGLYIPTAPAGFYVANWRVTGNTTNGSVICSASRCNLNYTSGTANLEVDIYATTRPTPPTLSLAGTTASSVALNWTAGSAGSATFSDYLPYLNGSTGYVTQARSYIWGGLSCGRTVSMMVAMRTSAGNWPSNTVSATTTACSPPRTLTPAPVPTPVPAILSPAPKTATKSSLSSIPKAAGIPGASNTTPNLITDPNAVPTTPGNFQAAAASENALVTISWDASTDVNGVQGYKLERSLDQTNWTVIGGDIVNPSFLDDTVAFGVHYYYRLSAVSVVGKSSGYALGDISTGQFAANSVGSSSGVYSSADKVARVEVSAGAVGADSAVCTVEKTISPFGTTDRPAVAGPYSLVCKTASGDLLSDFNKPVSWTYDLKTKLKGFNKPSVVSVDSSGGQSEVKDAAYNAKAQTLQFNQSSATTTAVLASKNQGIPGNLIAVVLVLILAIGGVFTLVLRKSQKQNYSEYLRRKYYDL